MTARTSRQPLNARLSELESAVAAARADERDVERHGGALGDADNPLGGAAGSSISCRVPTSDSAGTDPDAQNYKRWGLDRSGGSP
jgi:hypothetical protein